MLIYVKKKKKKKLFTDRRTDRRTTQNYSSEPHKTSQNFFGHNSGYFEFYNPSNIPKYVKSNSLQ